MRQLLQDLRGGETLLVDVPTPGNRRGCLVIRSVASLVSIGTEKMMISFGKASWLNKARQQPDKVRQVIEKIKTDGLVTTVNAVNAKLDQAIPLGYSSVGRVVSVGEGVLGFKEGDLVVSNGPHAEVVCVEKNLVSRVPEGIIPEEASFTVVASIGLQGIRLLEPTLGETIAVTGLGLIGLLSVQILRANGCRVIGIDFDSKKCDLARRFGAETIDLSDGGDPVAFANKVTRGKGVDGVLITASTKSNDPVHQGALMCRKRGRIVLVGVAGLELSRDDFYKKELSFQVSCSYGPGRYDPVYESEGHDYPYGFVRWTEQRNFEAVLGLLANGSIDVKPLISHRFDFSDALSAYHQLDSGRTLGIVINYSDEPNLQTDIESKRVVALCPPRASRSRSGVLGVVGAGGFTRQILLPALANTGMRLKTIVSSKGVSGTELGKKFGFENSATDTEKVLDDPEIDAILITTRHDSHATLVLKGLEAGKRVYVEKPLCLNLNELDQIYHTYRILQENGKEPFLMVGYNRRFAPQIVKLKSLLLASPEPKAMTMIVNAGRIPVDHWTQDRSIGGGRIIGEACHFIDLLRFIAGIEVRRVVTSFCGRPGTDDTRDTATILLEFNDGSTGTIQYLANGNKAVSKERLEVYTGGKIVILDNFRQMVGYGFSGFRRMNLWRQDKGHGEEMAILSSALQKGERSPIPFDEIIEVTKVSLEAAGDQPD